MRCYLKLVGLFSAKTRRRSSNPYYFCTPNAALQSSRLFAEMINMMIYTRLLFNGSNDRIQWIWRATKVAVILLGGGWYWQLLLTDMRLQTD